MKSSKIEQNYPELVAEIRARAAAGEPVQQIAVGVGRSRQWVAGVMQELQITHNKRQIKHTQESNIASLPFLDDLKKIKLSFVTYDKAKALLEAIAACSPLPVACMASSVSASDFAEWRDRANNKEPGFFEFFQLLEKSQAFAIHRLELKILEGDPGWQGAQVLLKAMLPDVYDPKSAKENNSSESSALRDTPTSVLDSILASRYTQKAGPSEQCGDLAEFGSDFGKNEKIA